MVSRGQRRSSSELGYCERLIGAAPKGGGADFQRMWKERSGPSSREEQAFVLSPTLLGVKVVAGGSSSGGEQPRRVLHSPLSLLVEALARCGPGGNPRTLRFRLPQGPARLLRQHN